MDRETRSGYSPKRSLFLATMALVAICEAAHPVSRQHTPSRADRLSYFFDCGDAASVVAEPYLRVTPSTRYRPELGYGWTTPPDSSFSVPRRRFLDERTTDGVLAASQVSFRIDAVPGDYLLVVIAGGGDEEIRGMRLTCGPGTTGEAFSTPWYRLPYRTLAMPVRVGKDGLVLDVVADTSRIDPGFERLLVGNEVRYASPQARVGVHAIELHPLGEKIKQPLSPGSIVPDTAALRAKLNGLEKDTRPGTEEIELQRYALRRYLDARWYYDAGWWSSALTSTGMNFFLRLWLASDLLRPLAADPRMPLYPAAAALLGKIHYWLYQEQHETYNLREAERFLRLALETAPGDTILRMYLGERFPARLAPPDSLPVVPSWARGHREAIGLMLDVIHWWVTERQGANGELGGGFGDDVEFLESWLPAVLVADDSLARVGLRRMAEGIWHSGLLHRGFLKEVQDVEHSAEYMSESHPFMLLLEYGDPVYVERCRISMQNFRDVWTGINASGHRHFRSMMLGADSVVAAPPFAVDVAMNARAAVPGLWALWYNDDPAIGQLFREWGEAWVEDAARADKGKPPGIIPPAVRFDNDEIGGYSENWYDPLLGWDYYPWGYFSGPTEMYLHLTGMSVLMEDSSFVTPLRESLRYALATPVAEPSHAHPAGSPSWISSVLRGKRAGQSDLASIVALADQHSADPLYREFLRRFGRPIERFRYSGDTSALLEGYQRIVQALRVNFPLRTSEVKFTDRISMEGVDHLFAAGTGGGGWAKGFPSPAVTWEGTGREVAVLVTEAGRNVVRARLFNCGSPTTVQARLWQVPEGTYRVRVTHSDNGRTTKESSWRLPERGARYAIPVPTGVEVEVVWELAAPGPMASRTRPDLALTTRDIVWHGDTLVVPVHNIGSADAARVRLTVSESGLPNVTVDIPLVSASLDLAPSVVTVRVPVPRHAATLVVDVGTPEREITLVNNRVTLRRETP